VASRRLAREHALQILFQLDMTGDDPETGLDLHWRGRDVDEVTLGFAERVVRGAIADAVRIDTLIREASENWRIERMAAVDRNVLRVAIYELLHEKETPAPVVIDEAIEIAKRFGGEDSGNFVNGVLDAVYRGLQKPAGSGAR
jgi:transcription antitermination protein NusB